MPLPTRPVRPSAWGTLLRCVLVGMALVPPVVGAWVGSTLAARLGAPREASAAVAVLLVLVLPLAWDIASRPRRVPGGGPPKRWLRMPTRLLLRACVLHVVFLVAVLLLSPRGVFTALSRHGDWMLPPGDDDAKVRVARRLVFGAADCVEWAYVLATDNPYAQQLIARAEHSPQPNRHQAPRAPEPAPSEPQPSRPAPAEPPREAARPSSAVDAGTGSPLDEGSDVVIAWKKPEPRPSEPTPAPEEPLPEHHVRVELTKLQPQEELPDASKAGKSGTWPMTRALHPRVTTIPASEETDYKLAAEYLVRGEHDPFQRIKALHDYVADRVAYDGVGYLKREFSSQTPKDVFTSRKAVCAGYANLFAAMGRAVGEEVVTLYGDALGFKPEPEGHAWNAVRINGDWYLVDVTWDSGGINATTGAFSKNYRTQYLFMPPDDFVRRHFPADPHWQLLESPWTRGEFIRRNGKGETPVASGSAIGADSISVAPSAHHVAPTHAGIRIRVPSDPRPQVRGRFPVELFNPMGLRTRVRVVNPADGSFADCPSEYGGVRFACTVLGRGAWRVEVYASLPSESSEALVDQLEVTGT